MARKKLKESSFIKMYGKQETSTVYEPEAGSNEMELVIDYDKSLTRVRFRNVGDRNEAAAIQFSISEYNRDTNRTKHISFSVPQPLAELFLSHLNTVK